MTEEPSKAREFAEANVRVANAVERARAASARAMTWAVVSIGLAAFGFGFALRGLLDGLGHP